MTLPLDVSRCSGRYDFDPLRSETCPERKTCQRYMAWVAWDRLAGIPDYKGIPVTMAQRECEIKIELRSEDAS